MNNPFIGDAISAIGQSLLGLGSGRKDWGLLGIQALDQRRQDRLANTRQAMADQQQAQLFDFQKQRFAAEQAQQQQAQQQQAKLAQFQQLLPTLPQNLQPIAQAMGPDFLDQYGKIQVEQAFPKPQEPNSAVAKAAADLKAGLIDKPTYDRIVQKETYIAPQQPKSPNWITLVGRDGKEVTVDGNSPQAQALVGQGFVERRSSLFPSAPTGYQYDPNTPGALMPTPGGPADPTNPNNITNDQRLSAGYADRLTAADKVISDNTDAGTSYIDAGLSSLPIVGNMVSSDGRQQYDQAKRDFITAQLRKESGASISPGEFATAEKQYFPQPGDSKDVIEQKAKARKIAIDNMLRNAAGAVSPQQPAPDNDPLGIR